MIFVAVANADGLESREPDNEIVADGGMYGPPFHDPSRVSGCCSVAYRKDHTDYV